MNIINKNFLLTSTSKQTYTINGKGSFTMYEVVEEFIKFRLAARLSITEIDNEIKSYIYPKPSKLVYVSDSKGTVYREVKNGRPGHFGSFTYNGQTVKYMKEWKDVPDRNFGKFRVGVSKAYPGIFEIDRILLPTSGSVLLPKASKTSTPITTGTKSTSTSKQTYTINGKGSYTMYEVLEEFIKFRLNARLSISAINNEIKSYIYLKPSKLVYVSDSKGTVYREVKRGKPHFGIFTYDGQTVKYMKEWKDNDGGNFRKFREGVNDKYPGIFEIDRI